MQIIFYITIVYIISGLCSLIVFTIYYFDNKTDVMDKDDFNRAILLGIVPVFNIMLLLGVLAFKFYELLICLKNKLTKK